MVSISFIFFTVVVLYCKAQEENEERDCRLGLCWRDSNYPKAELSKKLEKHLHTFGQFLNDKKTHEQIQDTTCNLCNVKRGIKVHPLTLREKGKLYYVVNTEKYQQTIEINICEDKQEGSECEKLRKDNESTGLVTPSGTIGCEQKYTSIRLLCYDPTTKEFKGKLWNYESSCACTIKEK